MNRLPYGTNPTSYACRWLLENFYWIVLVMSLGFGIFVYLRTNFFFKEHLPKYPPHAPHAHYPMHPPCDHFLEPPPPPSEEEDWLGPLFTSLSQPDQDLLLPTDRSTRVNRSRTLCITTMCMSSKQNIHV